jgi:hypothetical protein
VVELIRKSPKNMYEIMLEETERNLAAWWGKNTPFHVRLSHMRNRCEWRMDSVTLQSCGDEFTSDGLPVWEPYYGQEGFGGWILNIPVVVNEQYSRPVLVVRDA